MNEDYTVRRVITHVGSYYQVIKYTPEFSANTVRLVPRIMLSGSNEEEAERWLKRHNVYKWTLESQRVQA